MKRALVSVIIVTAAACGGSGGGGTPTAPAVLTVEAYGGSVTASAAGGGCNSSSHNFTSRAGAMSIRLDATNAAAQDIGVQICTGGGNTKTCSLPQQRIVVGQTLNATSDDRIAQTLTLLRRDCTTGATQTSAPVTYAVTLTYLK